jgi:hypothetical protein
MPPVPQEKPSPCDLPGQVHVGDAGIGRAINPTYLESSPKRIWVAGESIHRQREPLTMQIGGWLRTIGES